MKKVQKNAENKEFKEEIVKTGLKCEQCGGEIVRSGLWYKCNKCYSEIARGNLSQLKSLQYFKENRE